MRVAVLALHFSATGAYLFVGAVALRAAAGRVLTILVRHALLVALHEGGAFILIAATRHALEAEVAVVLIELLPLKTSRRLDAVIRAAA